MTQRNGAVRGRAVSRLRMAVAHEIGCRLAIIAGVLAGLAVPQAACAQDMEPRAYSASPIGTNFLGAGFSDTSGSVSLDPSLPIKGLEASIQTYTLGYDRSFDLFGRSASAAILVPDLQGSLSGQVLGQGRTATRAGLGDLKMRFAMNLLGGPALTPAEFAHREPDTTLGTSLTVVAPTGQYDASRLINIGANRWALKPELGLSQPWGKWFAETYAGAWVYSDNGNFYGGHVRGQGPIYTFQFHGGYTFRPRWWLSVDATHYIGGQTTLDGAANDDSQSVTRYGLTLSVPVWQGFSVKTSWSNWLSSRNGGDYQTFGVTLQYAWLDGFFAGR